MRLTQQMAAKEGWAVSEEDYYRNYLALDDRGIVEHLFISHGRAVDRARVEELVEWKSRVYGEIIENGLPAMAGAVDFVRRAAKLYPLAIASGSARSEIEHLLGKLHLRDCFRTIASLQALSEFADKPLRPRECVAIEDAPGGIDAAHAAGIRCIGLAHSRKQENLLHADWAFSGFEDLDLEAITHAFEP